MKVIDLGVTDFLKAYEFQLSLVKDVASGEREDTLLLTEHKSVITIGRKGSKKNILRTREFLSSRGIDIVNVDRGGGVTYHGPGQIIAYPVFRLQGEGRDIHNFLHFLEEVGTYFLMQYGLIARERLGLRGLWIEEKKIGSIGIGVKKWVAYHGLAINIDLDLTPFSFIRPCGLKDVKVTCLKKEISSRLDISDAKDKLAQAFKEVPLLAETVSSS